MQGVDKRLPEIDDCLYRVAVRAIIMKDGKYLMVQENEGWYAFPGGGIEYGESPIEALIREFKEELHIELSSEQITELSFVNANVIIDGIPKVNIWYKVSLDKAEIPTTGDLPYIWISRDSLEKRTDLGPSALQFRKKVLEIT